MWKTQITNINNNKMYIYGYDLLELMQDCSFADVVLIMATGHMPKLHQKKLMEAILISCCDQGVYPPSTNATRFVASCGVPLQASVAAGILGFGEYHGGAIEACAKLLQQTVQDSLDNSVETTAYRVVAEYKDRNRRIPGFGHAYFDSDPRSKKLLEIADSCISPHPHIDLLRAIENVFSSQRERPLAANINGAIGAAISDLGIDWRMGRGIFIVSRAIGLVCHALEEVKGGTKYKKIGAKDIDYQGPPPRDIPLRIEPS